VRGRDAAEIQTLLEGVSLPASKQKLVSYARGEDERAASELESLPDREYRSLDEVGEALAPVQAARAKAASYMPREESDKLPGGDDYTRAHPNPGAVRPRAPEATPPQAQIEQQTKTQKEQQERQQQLG
jgi:hypothetical protein